MESAIERDSVRRGSRNEAKEGPVSRKNSFERKGGRRGGGIRLSYVEIGNRIFRISVGNSAHFVLC